VALAGGAVSVLDAAIDLAARPSVGAGPSVVLRQDVARDLAETCASG
jgi:hypothetical protein